MADRRTTLLQCSLRIRRGRKWKTRWCTLTKLSPISDQVILRFYKNKEAVESSKEIGREQISISAQNFCGLSLAYRYSKNPYVLTVICLDFVVLLSFEDHGELLNWYHKIQNTLPSAAEFQTRVIVPNQPSKINPGHAILHFYDNHFALTPAIPKELIGSWSLSSLQKYTFVGDSVFFSSTTSKGEKTFVLVTKDVTVAANLKNHFDLATSVQSPSRGGEQSPIPSPEHGSSHPANTGNANNQNSSIGGNGGGGSSTYRRNQEEYETHPLPLPPHSPGSAPISRANSIGSQSSSFGSARQYNDYIRMRSREHEPVGSSPRLQSPDVGTGGAVPLQDLTCRNLETSASGANSEDVFGFWEPTSSVSGHDHSPEETKFLYECMPEADLAESAAREQNYEVMNTFDHIRQRRGESPMTDFEEHHAHPRCVHCEEVPPRPRVGSLDGDPSEESSYMNLFTRRSAGSMSVPTCPPPLPPIFIPHPGETDTSASLPTPATLPPPVLPGNHPSGIGPIDYGPGNVMIVVPAPFEHCLLVQPTGPIAMLKSSDSLSSDSGESASSRVRKDNTASGAGNVGGTRAKLFTSMTLPRGRQNTYPTDSNTWRTLQTHRKYSMPPTSGNLLPDTRQNQTSNNKPSDEPPELPPRLPPREPFLPSGPSPLLRQRCYTDSALKAGPSSTYAYDSERGYLMMKPAYEDKLKTMYGRSHSVTSAAVDVAIPTSPLGFVSRVYKNQNLGPWDRSSVSPSLVRSYKGQVAQSGRYLKRSATVGTGLTRHSTSGRRDTSSTINSRRGSLPQTAQPKSLPQRSYSTVSSSNLPRPRTSRDYASIDPEEIARKNDLGVDPPFVFSDTSGSGVDMNASLSSLSDLSSQASNSRASSFGSQSGVGLLYPRRQRSDNLKEADTVDDVNGNR